MTTQPPVKPRSTALVALIALLLSAALSTPAPALAQDGDPTVAAGGEGLEHDHEAWDDFLDVWVHSGKAFVSQFTHLDTLAILGGTAAVSVALIWREIEVQNRLESFRVVGEPGFIFGDIAGIGINFPIVPVGGYIWGRVADDERLIHFSEELAATQLLTSLEVLALSTVPYFHQRPTVERGEMKPDSQSFFEGAFRGASSYPAGHTIGLSVLAIKGWEWYGWMVGVPATAATLVTGWARIEEGKHFLSDVLTTYALAGVASIAVSRTRDLPTEAAWSGELSRSTARKAASDTLIMPTMAPGGLGLAVGGVF